MTASHTLPRVECEWTLLAELKDPALVVWLEPFADREMGGPGGFIGHFPFRFNTQCGRGGPLSGDYSVRVRWGRTEPIEASRCALCANPTNHPVFSQLRDGGQHRSTAKRIPTVKPLSGESSNVCRNMRNCGNDSGQLTSMWVRLESQRRISCRSELRSHPVNLLEFGA